MSDFEMRLLCEINDDIRPMINVVEEDFRKFLPVDLVGIPRYFCMTKNDGLRLWPKPIKDVAIWRLEPQAHADSIDLGK